MLAYFNTKFEGLLVIQLHTKWCTTYCKQWKGRV